MPTMQNHEEEALFALQAIEEDLAQGQRSAEDRERFLFYLSRHGRIAAISGLLVRADVATFRERLLRSATWRLRLLREREAGQRPFNGFSCAGQIAPLCDALAASADALARELAVKLWITR